MCATAISDLMPKLMHELGRFAGVVALLFALPDWADDATGRSGFGKAAAGVPDPAINSCAEADIVKVAAKTAAVAICITTPT
jgi:hypothetical protein